MGLSRFSRVSRLGDSINEHISAQLDAEKSNETVLSDDLFQFAEHDKAAAERSGYSNYSYWSSTFRIFWNNKAARFLILFLAALLVFTFIQPYLPGQIDPNLIHYDENGNLMKNLALGEEGFLFGTDNLGRDVWSRVSGNSFIASTNSSN